MRSKIAELMFAISWIHQACCMIVYDQSVLTVRTARRNYSANVHCQRLYGVLLSHTIFNSVAGIFTP